VEEVIHHVDHFGAVASACALGPPASVWSGYPAGAAGAQSLFLVSFQRLVMADELVG
jgi:hypothetical protein